jgi:two-component system, OmpR family, sensor kinase
LFTSLRGRLIASYALVIVMTIALVGVGFAYVIRAYQIQIQLNQLADLALPLAFQVRSLERSGAQSTELDQFLHDQANELNVRILIVGANRHLTLDTDRKLVGAQLPLPTNERKRLNGTMQWGSLDVPGEQPLTFVAMSTPAERLPGPDRSAPRPTDTFTGLVVAVPQSRLSDAWLQLAPSLILGALIALVVAIGVAFFLARSISRPLAQVTVASEKMATGDFDQFIAVAGHDEIGQLATSFNTMAREVGRIHQTMRDLLANVSHELRTPLTSIEGYSQAMCDGTIQTPAEYRDAASIIGEEAQRMYRLVEDLLYLSRIESGQIAIDRSRVDLPELLRSCVREVQPQVDGAGLTLELNAEPTPPVLADAHRLQQVFVNLLDNAVRHTPPSGSIALRARSALPGSSSRVSDESSNGRLDGRWVAVDVHNTGSYIPPDHVHRIFERFYQVDRSRSRGAEGSGLGLSIVREIVQAHQGRVEVASDPTRGTTFTVFLPAA